MHKLVELKGVAAAAKAAGRPFATADALPYLLVALSEAVVRCLNSSNSSSLHSNAEHSCQPTAAELKAAAAAAVVAALARAVPA
jgi:hypothetical protein